MPPRPAAGPEQVFSLHLGSAVPWGAAAGWVFRRAFGVPEVFTGARSQSKCILSGIFSFEKESLHL